MSKITTILWFRQDLRLKDNPALVAAVKMGHILPIYILDTVHPGKMMMGSASCVWLHHALGSLNQDLGGNLNLYQGNPIEIIQNLVNQYRVKSIFWNRCYEPWRMTRDKIIKSELSKQHIAVHSFNGSLLWEPWEVNKADGTPYRVFTPFFKKGCLNANPPAAPLNQPKNCIWLKDDNAVHLDSLKLLPKQNWPQSLIKHWEMSERGAHTQLKYFIEHGIIDYKTGRDFPAQKACSKLSPYLHFGQISPRFVWHSALKWLSHHPVDTHNAKHFMSELGWREFSYYLLYHFPALPHENWNPQFNAFPWQTNDAYLLAWQRGQTGYPIVDAGMRELWQTGYMHNRIRMVVASFLIKNCLIDWRLGERWFWDCLFDADLASNAASWQWVAGCGADAAPYFRIFNPITQGQKFDPGGKYTRQYVPELSRLDIKYLFNPWDAPDDVLKSANIKLGSNYPRPIIDLKSSRKKALKAYDQIKRASS